MHTVIKHKLDLFKLLKEGIDIVPIEYVSSLCNYLKENNFDNDQYTTYYTQYDGLDVLVINNVLFPSFKIDVNSYKYLKQEMVNRGIKQSYHPRSKASTKDIIYLLGMDWIFSFDYQDLQTGLRNLSRKGKDNPYDWLFIDKKNSWMVIRMCMFKNYLSLSEFNPLYFNALSIQFECNDEWFCLIQNDELLLHPLKELRMLFNTSDLTIILDGDVSHLNDDDSFMWFTNGILEMFFYHYDKRLTSIFYSNVALGQYLATFGTHTLNLD